MNEIIFLVGLTVGIVIGVPTLARLWRVNLRGAFKRMQGKSHPDSSFPE